MVRIYESDEADPGIVRVKKVAIIGFGNQAKAHAKNLRDSGVELAIGLREGSPNRALAESEGFVVKSPAEAAAWAELIMILTPDETQGRLFRDELAPGVTAGKAMAFAHGFAIRFEQIVPPEGVDVILVAPTGPGTLLRSLFVEGKGLPCLIAVEQDATGGALALALSYASALGADRAAMIETSFQEECETDLFGEQVVVCGGLTSLITSAFDTLVEAGYAPEIAYFECAHQVQLLAAMIQKRGVAGMRKGISNTARYGDLTRGPRIIDEHVRAEMKKVLAEVQSGAFAKEWVTESQGGSPHMAELAEKAEKHPIEAVGKKLRARMSWLDD